MSNYSAITGAAIIVALTALFNSDTEISLKVAVTAFLFLLITTRASIKDRIKEDVSPIEFKLHSIHTELVEKPASKDSGSEVPKYDPANYQNYLMDARRENHSHELASILFFIGLVCISLAIVKYIL
jgi:hypothetical protein